MAGWFKVHKGKAKPAEVTTTPAPGGGAKCVFVESGLTVDPNAGGGNCGGHAIAFSLREYKGRADCVDVRGKEAKFASITHLDVRAAVVAELRANPSTYAPGIVGAMLRDDIALGQDGAADAAAAELG